MTNKSRKQRDSVFLGISSEDIPIMPTCSTQKASLTIKPVATQAYIRTALDHFFLVFKPTHTPRPLKQQGNIDQVGEDA